VRDRVCGRGESEWERECVREERVGGGESACERRE